MTCESMAARILKNTDHQLYTVKDGIVVVKKGAVLQNGFVI